MVCSRVYLSLQIILNLLPEMCITWFYNIIHCKKEWECQILNHSDEIMHSSAIREETNWSSCFGHGVKGYCESS